MSTIDTLENSIDITPVASNIQTITNNIKKIIVTSDILKIDDRNNDKHINPQRINAEWMKNLVANIIGKTLSIDEKAVIYEHGDIGGYDSIRWKVYSSCGLPLESQSWAAIYEGNEFFDELEPILYESYKDSLVICFEASPLMLKVFNKNNIPYIDFSIHPVRFLPDYMFGIRTNVEEWRKKISAVKIAEDVFYDFARVSRARTTRIMRGTLPIEDSALFMGQIEIDSSLICNGTIATEETVENALIELSSIYPKVYYKRHPHSKSEDALKKIVSKIKNCEWIDVNVYDAFGCGRFDLVASLSSGSVTEAKYFDIKTKWILPKQNYFCLNSQEKSNIYYPIYQDAMKREFWDYVLGSEIIPTFIPTIPNAFDGAMKFNLNMKWGR
ncbi:hypothetical protein GNG27_03085 [Leclercia sp. 119287]|uniref:hypothetical protein n=1 Tax=Leclercia sp. 119287 TaxID=2681308 RepID=UPI0012E2443B|nr:hypothetical protein [Leclercia sp. 119287]QGU13695.1 hypothetical protein GNG27_03085 [Leclercia sp. 119287]